MIIAMSSMAINNAAIGVPSFPAAPPAAVSDESTSRFESGGGGEGGGGEGEGGGGEGDGGSGTGGRGDIGEAQEKYSPK